MAVNSDGSLHVGYEDGQWAGKSDLSAKAVHLKKDGSPDKRFKENR